MSSPSPSRAMGIAPSTSSISQFRPQWKDSDADAFSLAHVTSHKIPRAWERQAQSPFDRKKGYKKVWRRYNLRRRGDAPDAMAESNHDANSASDSECGAQKTPARVVKKRRAGSVGPDVSPRKRVQSKATKWDRRKSGLPRKQAPLLEIDYAPCSLIPESINLAPQTTTEPSSTDTDLEGHPPGSPNAEQFEDLRKLLQSEAREDQVLDNITDSLTTSHATPQPDVSEQVDDAHVVIDTVKLGKTSSSKDLDVATTLDEMEDVASFSEVGEAIDASADLAQLESTLENESSPPSSMATPADARSPVARPESGLENAALHDTSGAAEVPKHTQATQTRDEEPRQISISAEVDVREAFDNAADTQTDFPTDGAECSSQAEAEYLTISSGPDNLLLFSPAGPRDACSLDDDINVQELVDEQCDSDQADPTPLAGPSETSESRPASADESSPVAPAVPIESEEPKGAANVRYATVSVPTMEDNGLKRNTAAIAHEQVDVLAVSSQQHPAPMALANSRIVSEAADESMTDPTVSIVSFDRKPVTWHSAPSLPLEPPRSISAELSSTVPHEPPSPGSGHNDGLSAALIRTTDSDEDDEMSEDGDAPGFDDIADTIKLNLSMLSEQSIDTVDGKTEGWEHDTDEQACTSELMEVLSASASTENVANHLDADTAHLMEFLNRAAANKQDGPTVIARRSSLQNRRDSDAVRHALASPRKPLEDKDVNSPLTRRSDDNESAQWRESLTSPSKEVPATARLSDDADIRDSESSPRRSTRSRRRPSGVPPGFGVTEPSALGPNRITMRRPDGTNPVVLERDPSIRLAYLTRQNTKKNKGNAVLAPARLLKLTAETQTGDAGDTSSHSTDGREGARNGAERNVRWDEQLVYFFNEATTNPADVADKVSTAMPVPTPSKATEESKLAKAATKAKRQRGLGAANGTPAKGLLATATYLPMEVQAEHSEAAKAKTSKARPASKLLPPSTTTTARTSAAAASRVSKLVPPSSRTVVAEAESKLAAPKAVKLPRPKPSVAGGLTHLNASAAKETSLSTPKKPAGIPTPRKSSVPRKFA